MNNVSIYVSDNELVVEYGDDRNVTMKLETEQERELVLRLMDDINLWANFLSSLSAAITNQLGSSRDQ